MKTIEGKFDAKEISIAIVVSRFNEFITSKLLGGAVDAFVRHNGIEDKITTIWVPGAFEIPAVASRAALSKKYDAVICLGAVIRGSTPHFDYVAAEASKGVAQAGLSSGIPVIFGVLTTDSIEQAIERAGTKSGNKGFEAMMSAIEMVSLYRQI